MRLRGADRQTVRQRQPSQDHLPAGSWRSVLGMRLLDGLVIWYQIARSSRRQGLREEVS